MSDKMKISFPPLGVYTSQNFAVVPPGAPKTISSISSTPIIFTSGYEGLPLP